MITLDQFINNKQNQSVLYAANADREKQGLRGQCVQLAMFYVIEVCGKPVIWADASQWYTGGLFPQHYQRIANTTSAVPQRGDLIVWGSNLAGSGGAGHIAIVTKVLTGTGTFISFDTNWGGKTAHLVTHNYNNVIGWLRPIGVNVDGAQAPVVTNPSGGNEMIANADQAVKIYKMLRPNGVITQAEIDSTAGRRTFANFLNDAQQEVAQRDANIANQWNQLTAMQNTINQLNETVTKVTADDATDKEALAGALAQVGSLTADLVSARDAMAELQAELNSGPKAEDSVDQGKAAKTNFIVKIINAILGRKSS